MPKRTNDFQRLVYLVRVNLANGATVTESKMLRDRVTKRWREVDVCINGHVGTHPVLVCVECRDHQRVADVTWVDMMKAKHDRLATNALILASRSGFTPEARSVAAAFGIQTFALENIDAVDFPMLLAPESSLWVKLFTISTEKVSVRVPATELLAGETIATTPDNLIHAADGSEICQISALVDPLLHSAGLRDYIFQEGREDHVWFELVWEPPRDHLGNPLYMKKLDPEVLREIVSIRVTGPCKIGIERFGLRHGKLGDIHVAWAKGQVSGKDTMVVTTKDASGVEKLSINFAGPSPQRARLTSNV